jgi:N-acetylglutamate synthase-like GNAT family acetyltransferase
MEPAELEIAAYLAYKEGWNPGIADGWAFYQQDPKGFFIAEIDSRVVGCISAVKYSADFGFIGFYVVEEEFRNSIAGTQLGLAALNYLQECNIGIDGVLQRVANYERIGFELAYKNARFESIGSNYLFSSNVVKPECVDIQQIYDYDSQCFPAPRPKFIDAWLKMPNTHSYCYVENGNLKGWGTIRSCRKGLKIGPLFADNYDIANEIYKALSNYAIDELLYLDIPMINNEALKIANKYGMKLVFETARMYSKNSPNINIQKIFGVTSFELG